MLLYGSNLQDNYVLNTNTVSKQKIPYKKAFSWLSILRGILIVGEIALALAADAFTEGAASPILGFAVGEVAGGLNEGLDYKQGYLSILNSFINFGAPFIAVGPAIKGPKTLIKGLTVEEYSAQLTASKLTKGVIRKEEGRLAKLSATRTRELFLQNLGTQFESAKSNAINLERYFPTLDRDSFDRYRKTWSKSISSSRKYNFESNAKTMERIKKNLALKRRQRDIALNRERAAQRAIKLTPRIGTISSIGKKFASHNVEFEYAAINNEVEPALTMTKTLGKEIAYKYSRKVDYGRSILQKLRKEENAPKIVALQQTATLINTSLTKQQSLIFTQILDMRTRPSDVDNLIKGFMRTLNKQQHWEIGEYTNNLQYFLKKGYRTKTNQNSINKFIRTIGSRRYYWKVVKKAQLINPTDAGREPLEYLYKWSKKKLRQNYEIAKKSMKQSERDINDAKLGRMSKSVAKQWEKGGGVWLGGRYVLGYKPIPDSKAGIRELILIRFNPFNTAAKHEIWNDRFTNNFKGKKDVIVSATPREITKLATYGGAYYNSKWARTLGGETGNPLSWNRASKIDTHTSRALTLFLGVFPINALRNNLSIVSNWSNQLYKIGTHTYTKNYVREFTRSLVRAASNRPFRLLNRVVLPGEAEHIVGRVVAKQLGREVSRAFNLGFSAYTTRSGKPFGFRKANKNELLRRISLGGISSMRSNTSRSVRSHYGYNVGLGSYQALRKFRQGPRRLAGAFVPRGVYNSRNFLKFRV